MQKILRLIADDFQTVRPSAEYMEFLEKFCVIEKEFRATLSNTQAELYKKLDYHRNELDSMEHERFLVHIAEVFKWR